MNERTIEEPRLVGASDKGRRGVTTWITLVLFVGTLLFFFLSGRGDIDVAEARRLVADGALLVDVRTAEEFAEKNISGAINIPVDELEERMSELGPKNTPMVLYCRSGNRSGSAARKLKQAGYTAVRDLGSMSRW